jgi:signal transduction histidine kinase
MTRAPSPDIEPGLIPIFRLFMGGMFVLLSIGEPANLQKPQPDLYHLFMWIISGVLFVYLAWKPIRRLIGRRWLPLGLWAASLLPIAAEAAANYIYAARGVTDPALYDAARLYWWLLIPLLLVSAQYGARALLAYSIGTALLPFVLAIPLGDWLDLNAYWTGTIVRLILYTAAGYVVMRITSAARRQRVELAEKNVQLARYATTLEQLAVARERNRLARELHDTLAHTLSAVNVQLKALDVLLDSDPTAARAALTQTQELTRTGLQEARRSLQALRARPIDELGIGLALGEMARRAAERAGLTLMLDVPAQINGLDDEAEHAVYRIAEEALNNVVRHANARHLAVTWAGETLTIRDDGRGFNADDTPDGRYGMTGMRERAALIDATLTITSVAGGGTTLTLMLKQAPR